MLLHQLQFSLAKFIELNNHSKVIIKETPRLNIFSIFPVQGLFS